MVTFLAWLILAIPARGGGEIDADSFARLVGGRWAELRDVNLVNEGELNDVGPAGLFKERPSR